MAKETVEKIEKTEREIRWEQHLVAYEARNPIKFAAKKAAGQYDRIPDTFN